MNYLEMLRESYKQATDWNCYGDMGKLEFIAGDIFEFVTYEEKVSSLMAQKALEVCAAISYNQTFEYISNEEGNLWYLIVVNMPFFVDKIEWGGSIRGAWWGHNKVFKIESCGLFQDGKQLVELGFNEQQWIEFIDAMLVFVNE